MSEIVPQILNVLIVMWFSLKVRSHCDDNDNGKSFLFFPPRMGNISLYGGVHMETPTETTLFKMLPSV